MAAAPTLFSLFSAPNSPGHGALIAAWREQLAKVHCPFQATPAEREEAASDVLLVLLERSGAPLAEVAPEAQAFYTARMFHNRLSRLWRATSARETSFERGEGDCAWTLDVAHGGRSAEALLAEQELQEQFETLLETFIAAQRGTAQPGLRQTLAILLKLRSSGMTARELLGVCPDFIQQRNALQKRFERLRSALLSFIRGQHEAGALADEDANLFSAQVATLKLK
jgi:hypothetical protein